MKVRIETTEIKMWAIFFSSVELKLQKSDVCKSRMTAPQNMYYRY
jgi:hypothetical protein